MYIVISEWETLPGHEQDFVESGRKMRALLRDTNGVAFVNAFEDESGRIFAVLAYDDQAAYDRVVNDPAGPFVKGAAETGIESHARWVAS